MARTDDRPGPLAHEKTWSGSPPGEPEPAADEVESAELLANEARTRLRRAGLDDERIRELADRYVAEDLDGDTGAFIAWALRRSGATR